MNISDLQNDFHKRFEVVNNKLVFSKSGLLCTLLGHNDLKGMMSVSCTLSMGIKVLGHKIGSGTIQLEDTDIGIYEILKLNDLLQSNKSLAHISSQFNHLRPFGAEILYNNTIPQCFSPQKTLETSILNTLLKLADWDYSNMKKAVICANGKNPDPYLSVFSSRKGHCISICNSEAELLPLPMTGLKLLSVQTSSSQSVKPLNSLKKTFNLLHKLYPHILSYSDISYNMLDDIKSHLKKNDVSYLRHIISENDRISASKRHLRACNILEFAEVVNMSQHSIELFWECSDEHKFLADLISEAEDCLCARQWKNGIIAIISEDSADSIINIIRHSFNSRYGYEPIFCIADTDTTS